jgi:5-methylcytosine-specific restriction endonuclease McrA
VHITNVRRALVLVFGDHARVVTDDYATHDFDSWRDLSSVVNSHHVIRTPNYQIAAPEVILLTQFSKFPPRQVKFSRRNIYMRDNYTCQYCGRVPPRDELTIDHVVPRARGGKSTWDNVVLACMRCNMRKGSRTVRESGLELLTKPKKPHWFVCTHFTSKPTPSSLWQKFIDNAYWNTSLKE